MFVNGIANFMPTLFTTFRKKKHEKFDLDNVIDEVIVVIISLNLLTCVV